MKHHNRVAGLAVTGAIQGLAPRDQTVQEAARRVIEGLRPPPRPDPLDQVAASLAGGMLAASRRAHTAEEAVGVWRSVREATLT